MKFLVAFALIAVASARVFEPISVGPALVDTYEPIDTEPAYVDIPITDGGVVTAPVKPTPVVVGPAVPSGASPLVQLIVNVNVPAGVSDGPAEIKPDPVIVAEEAEEGPIVPVPEPVIVAPINPIPVAPVIIGTPIIPAPAVTLPEELN
ncbi:actin cytoskeleton-regulatory complex protein PAN1-like [Bombyx mandarina]|uniref:Actin cytoskeleton-regulatory complex protein PAN1-like n=2 Tax=Bombyx TaxID=7090 RepID=A0A6J2JBS1_BOMMA|nr:actin cytoskeleton-regulatory complex protein PAN1 [Bombyx mori]XP_028026945.1 actin cytoskeleton-regulatory complex protein PAN1-like [Bombyx mandarina]ACY06935.1 putative cuticle protein CPH40 [Bombyx mori]